MALQSDAAPRSMIPVDPVVQREIPVIQKIIADETWLEGERRGCSVAPTDQIVRAKVCDVILRIGQELRDSFSVTSTSEGPPGAHASVTTTHVERAS